MPVMVKERGRVFPNPSRDIWRREGREEGYSGKDFELTLPSWWVRATGKGRIEKKERLIRGK